MTENRMVVPGDDHPAYKPERPDEDFDARVDRLYERWKDEEDEQQEA